jgi:hypothetical protein
MRTSPETLLANGLKAIEPPKIEGGSPERRAWLKLILDTQAFLSPEAGKRFITRLLREE